MKLIGIAGRAGAGKTTIAKHLKEKHGYTRWSFADPLKEMLINSGMITYDEAYTEKTPQSRWLMQKIGTDIFRKQVHPLYWVNKMRDSIEDTWEKVSIPIVLDDIRFPEEAEMVRSLGGKLIMVKRTDHLDPTAGEHESECKVDTIECDYIFSARSGEVDLLLWNMDELIKRI